MAKGVYAVGRGCKACAQRLVQRDKLAAVADLVYSKAKRDTVPGHILREIRKELEDVLT